MADVIEKTEATEVEKLNDTIKALEAEVEKLKQANTNASSDAAEWKRKYRDSLDEAEREKAEREDRFNEMQSELESYKTSNRISSYTAKLVEVGYDADTAKNMASVLPEGVEDSFFEGQKSFLESQKTKIKQESLNSQPSLSQGMPLNGSSADTIEANKRRVRYGLPPL